MRNIHKIWIKQNFRTYLVAALMGLMLSLSFGAGAGHPVVKSIDTNGLVIDGYDVVAYFTMGDAVKGSKDISADWLGGKWLFANDEHRDLFFADPTKYTPQYGGYCSSGTRTAKHSDIDPKAWQMVDNKLYLFYSIDSATRWMSNPPSVVTADKHWDKAKAGLTQQ
jgi:hypothetical protein